MKTTHTLFAASLLAFALSACNNSSDDDHSMAPVDTGASSVDQAFGNDAGGDAIDIGDADALAADLDQTFGTGEAVAVEDGDSINDVRQRAQGS
jgi:hypothetical protein